MRTSINFFLTYHCYSSTLMGKHNLQLHIIICATEVGWVYLYLEQKWGCGVLEFTFCTNSLLLLKVEDLLSKNIQNPDAWAFKIPAKMAYEFPKSEFEVVVLCVFNYICCFCPCSVPIMASNKHLTPSTLSSM